MTVMKDRACSGWLGVAHETKSCLWTSTIRYTSLLVLIADVECI